jgi:hypothetical protein
MKTNPAAEREQIERLQAHRKNRNDDDVRAALQGLADAARSGENIMPSSIRCALAGVSTGEWGDSLRAVFGEFRPPTGIDIAIDSREVLGKRDQVTDLRARVASTGSALGPAPETAGRQTGARWTFQRRGTGRRQGQGCRLRGRLRRHPSDAATDCPGGAGGRRAYGRSVDPFGKPYGTGGVGPAGTALRDLANVPVLPAASSRRRMPKS